MPLFCAMSMIAKFYVSEGFVPIEICAGDLVKTLKENNFEYTWGNVTVKLANSYGFCWGVERAVQIAYEARKQFPEQKLWLTNEIIHNPTVNEVVRFLLYRFQSHNVGRDNECAYDLHPNIPSRKLMLFISHLQVIHHCSNLYQTPCLCTCFCVHSVVYVLCVVTQVLVVVDCVYRGCKK